MSKYQRIRHAILEAHDLLGAVAQLALWVAIPVTYVRGDETAFWQTAALLAILKLGEIGENIASRK
jgi:hypothetical protein